MALAQGYSTEQLKIRNAEVRAQNASKDSGRRIKPVKPMDETPSIDVETLKTSPPAPMDIPTPAPSTEASGLGAEIASTQDSFLKNLEERSRKAETAKTKSFEQLLDEVVNAKGETSLTDETYRDTVDPLEAELKDINQQILAEQQSLQRRLEKLDKNEQGLFGGALTQEKSRIEKESISKQADLAVIQLARQGKYDSAKAIADRAVSAKLEEQRQRLSILELIYNENKEEFTTAEQRAFETKQADRQRELDMKAQKEMLRYEDMIKNPSPGDPYGLGGTQSVISFEEYVQQRLPELEYAPMEIDPSSTLYQQLKTEYDSGVGSAQELGMMASNLRSLVAKTGPAASIYDRSYNNALTQGQDATERFLRAQYINNVLSGTERESYNNVQNGIENYKAAIEYLQQNPDLKTGFWIETAEGLKPKIGVKNDQRYQTLLSLINQAEAPIRKAQYGTAITGTELSLAMRSLLNTDQDRDTTLLKMQQAVTAYENGLNRNMANALGTSYTPKQIPTPAGTGGQGPVAGEDIYNSVMGEQDYDANFNQGLGQILNTLFIGY